MQKITKHTIYLFLCIVGLTAILCLGALANLWFNFYNPNNLKDLPYLGWFLSILFAEIIGVVVIIAKRGFKYIPDIKTNTEENQTLLFMKEFISLGSTVTIVSNRVAWLRKSGEIKEAIAQLARNGTLLEIITPSDVADDIKSSLIEAGVKFYVTNEKIPPEARFTLVDGQRSGAERLAIARGGHPEHEITIFDNNSGPQIIAMAKDIVRKSKELAHAPSVE